MLCCVLLCTHSRLLGAALPFPCLQWLQLVSVPPSTIEDFVTLRGHLIRLEVRDAGLDDLAGLFGTPTRDTLRRLQVFRDNYVLGAAARAKVWEGALACDGVAAGEATGPVTFVLPLDDFTETKGTKHINLLWSKLLFLRIHNCGLTRFDRSLSLLPLLSHLDVSGNSISRVIRLGGCLNLRVANLASNRFSSLTGIGGALSNVQRLTLSRNNITSLRGLAQLRFLEELALTFNQVSHVDEVQHLVYLRFLQELTLAGNPVATLFANTAANGALEHRHPMWDIFVKQQQCVWQEVSQNQRTGSVRCQEDARLQWAGRELYRVMVFAYFYPEISPTGYFRTREMVTLDGEDISEIESSIIK